MEKIEKGSKKEKIILMIFILGIVLICTIGVILARKWYFR